MLYFVITTFQSWILNAFTHISSLQLPTISTSSYFMTSVIPSVLSLHLKNFVVAIVLCRLSFYVDIWVEKEQFIQSKNGFSFINLVFFGAYLHYVPGRRLGKKMVSTISIVPYISKYIVYWERHPNEITAARETWPMVFCFGGRAFLRK